MNSKEIEQSSQRKIFRQSNSIKHPMSGLPASRRVNKLLSHLTSSEINDDCHAKIDHIVYWCDDLKKSIIKFERLLGVEAVISGKHLKWGSWNALFSLDNGTYFELLADDPTNSKQRSGGFLKSLIGNKQNGEGIVSFMCRPPKKYKNKLKEYKSMLQEHANFDYGAIFPGERKLNNNHILKWQLMRPLDLSNKIYNESKGILPTIIDWKFDDNKMNDHPSYTAPKGCKLLKLKCFHPKYQEINKIFHAMDMEKRFCFEIGTNVKFVATISCPKGIVIIS